MRVRLEELCAHVHPVAHDEDAWPLIEEIPWAQPSDRSPLGRDSTPVGLGWTDSGDVAILAHCHSRVITQFRDAFGDPFRFDGDRGVLFKPAEVLHADEVKN